MSEGFVGVQEIGGAQSGRRLFIGGSDARTIMGDDEASLLRLWREKRGEVEPEDLSANLIVPFASHGAPQPAFRFLGLAPLLSGSFSRICSIAVVRRRMDSARDGRSGCLRRHSSKRSKNLLESRI
jgi:hypothetical protein